MLRLCSKVIRFELSTRALRFLVGKDISDDVKKKKAFWLRLQKDIDREDLKQEVFQYYQQKD